MNWFLMALLMFLFARAAKAENWRRAVTLLVTMALYALIVLFLS